MLLTQILLLTALASAPFWLLYAQGSYEIQVYGSELVSPGATMFELHRATSPSRGAKTVVDGQYPTEHQLYETLEITHAKTRWFSQNRFAERRLRSWLCAAMSRCAAAELAMCSSAPF